MEKALILTRAKSAAIAHDFVTAARLYKELLRDDESNVEYLKQLGSIYVQSGEDEKAIPYYSQIITFYPHYIDAMNSLGAIYRRLKRYEESIEILQRALDEDRQLPAVNYNLGYTYREMGNYEDAIEAFEKVIRVNPDDVLAYNHLGSVYFAKKEYEKSVASYKRGLQIDRNHPILNYNLAKVYEAIKNYSDAVRCYQTALRTKPGWTDAIKDYTALLLNTKKSKEATDVIQQGIKLYPNNTEMLRILGDIYLNDYDYPSAEKTFKKACSIKPNDVQALVGLSKALEKSDKSEYALDAALSAMELDPNNRDAKKQYTQSLLSEKDYEAARDALASLYDEEGKRDLQVLDLQGQYFICNEEDDKARMCYEKIKHLDHHYKDFMVNAANRYAQIGKFEKAELYANEFLVHRPDNIDGYNALGKINYLKEDYAKATAYYEKACSLGKNNVLAEKQIKTIADKVERDKLFAEKYVEITGEPLNKEPIDLPVVNPEDFAKEAEEEELFDYSSIGGVTPLQEGLTQKEEDFWKADENDAEKASADNITEDDISPARKEDEKLKDALARAENPYETPFNVFDDVKKNSLEEEDDSDFDFSSFTPQTKKEDPEVAKEQETSADENNSANSAETTHDDIEEIKRVNKELTDKALDAAEKLEAQQQKLQEQTEEALKNALEKVRELEEQKYKDQDSQYEQMMRDAMDEPRIIVQQVPSMDDFLTKDEPLITDETTEDLEISETVEETAEENSILNEIPQADNETSVTDMLEKIGRILNDDDAAMINAEQIEMFKKLRVLCDYLPEAEKSSFQSCKNRMIIEYIISKMSGKPGLLLTALSLLKSGVLGDDYLLKSQDDEDNSDITNEMVRQVILCMQNMAESLDDKYLAQALRASADTILERIELENQKSKIF